MFTRKEVWIIEQWKEDALELWRSGVSWTNNALKIQEEYFPELNMIKAKDKVRSFIKRTPEYLEKQNTPSEAVDVDISDLLAKGTTLNEIKDKCGMTRRVALATIDDLKEQGYNIEQYGDEYKLSKIFNHGEKNVVHKRWSGDKVIRFGLLGDTHINSKFTQITHLHSLYDTFKKEGIEDVYHSGDIDEGEQMRQGHQYECYNQGADDHAEEIIRVYPKREGITTHFITGNHDHSFIKRAGLDIGYRIADERKDMNYLGRSHSIIHLTDNCTMELRHPGGRSAYAISYRPQKMIDAMSGGEKPNILAFGHYHKAEYLFYRNVHAIQTGCIQGQTDFMKGMSLAAMMGGWIIEIHVNQDGEITKIKQEFIPFYYAIEDDWKNWR